MSVVLVDYGAGNLRSLSAAEVGRGIVTASGGSDKTITGYFVDNYTNPQLTISACSALNCPRYLGSYVLELID